MLGGMGSPIGAVVGGSCSACSRHSAPAICRRNYKDAFAFIVILVVLFAMPQGLFGKAKRRARVTCRPLRSSQSRRAVRHRRADRGCAAAVFRRAYFYLALPRWFSSMRFAAIGLNLLMGFAGQVSLGHAGFFGVGAYAVAIGPAPSAFRAWFSMLAGAVLSGLLAFCRWPADLAAAGTLSCGRHARLRRAAAPWSSPTGRLDRRPERHAGAAADTVRLARAQRRRPGTGCRRSLSVGASLALNLIDSPTGRAFRAIHDSEIAARVLGIDVAA